MMALLHTIVVLSILASVTNALSIRGRSSTTGTCGTQTVSCLGRGGIGKTGQPRAQETRFELLGCSCALVGVRCAPDNSICIGPNGDLTPNIGNGSPKRGVCGCRSGFTQNCTSQTCGLGTCSISVSAASVALSNCAPAFGSTGLTIATTGCVRPLQFLLVVTSGTQGTRNDLIPYVGIDRNTLQVFANNLIPTSTLPTTQTYAAVAVDALGRISNNVTFSAVVQPFSTSTTVSGSSVPACTC